MQGILVRILPVLLVGSALAGCDEQTRYRVQGRYDDDYGQCWALTISSEWYARPKDLINYYSEMIERGYLKLEYQSRVWYAPDGGDIYIGGSKTDFPVPNGTNQVESVLLDYPCRPSKDEPRLYWVATERHDLLAALSLNTWQYDEWDGSEHLGRIIVLYELESLDRESDNLIFYYRDYFVLYDDDVGEQTVRDDPVWREAEEQAIHGWLRSL